MASLVPKTTKAQVKDSDIRLRAYTIRPASRTVATSRDNCNTNATIKTLNLLAAMTFSHVKYENSFFECVQIRLHASILLHSDTTLIPNLNHTKLLS